MMELRFGPDRLRGRVALVAGGGAWIGRAVCLRLASEGCDVIVDDIRGDKARAVAEEVHAMGQRAMAFDVDCRDFDAVQKMADEATAELGHIDIVVNNVGVGALDKYPMYFWDERCKPDEWQSLIDINLYTAMNTSRAVIEQMRERGWGRIINTSSGSGVRGCPGEVHYCAAKAAVNGFTIGLAHDVKDCGIRANCVVVAPIGDDPSKWPDGIPFGITPEQLLERDKKWMNLPRHGKPEEIAALIAFLASDEADWINGRIYETGGITE